MKDLPFVKLEHHQEANYLEEKLVELLPSFSGVLFVSVMATPTLSAQEPTYRVFVGCQQTALVDALSSLVAAALQPWSSKGLQFDIEVRRGRKA